MADLAAIAADLRDQGVQIVRVNYADLHGVMRGKDHPIAFAEHVLGDGAGFCEAVMTIDHRHNVVFGDATGFADIRARPDLSTLVRLPWDPTVAAFLADLEVTATGEPFAVDPRGALRAVVERFGRLGLEPIVGPELEFYLCEPDGTRYPDRFSSVYKVGDHADPRGVLRRLLDGCVGLGLDVFAANHEYGNGQFEINLLHSGALDAADRAFRFKGAIKDLATREGLVATFMGKPFADMEGSGFHLHFSMRDAAGGNAFDDPSGVDGLSTVARQFLAGVIRHAPAAAALLMPTVNAYRRIDPHSLSPTHSNWGLDNRMCFVRVPPERGRATRLETRVGDGTANPYLATAALLAAGLAGIEEGLEPPAALSGNPYEADEEVWGEPFPGDLGTALDALEGNGALRAALGDQLVATFLEIKRFELERYRTWVAEQSFTWEFEEYSHHL